MSAHGHDIYPDNSASCDRTMHHGGQRTIIIVAAHNLTSYFIPSLVLFNTSCPIGGGRPLSKYCDHAAVYPADQTASPGGKQHLRTNLLRAPGASAQLPVATSWVVATRWVLETVRPNLLSGNCRLDVLPATATGIKLSVATSGLGV